MRRAEAFLPGSWIAACFPSNCSYILAAFLPGTSPNCRRIPVAKPARRSAVAGLTLLARGERRYPDSPDRARIEVFANPRPGRDYTIVFDCPEFTTLCPVTGQPDFGRIRIEYVPGRWCIESKSLKLYLFSFRNSGAFHEAAANRILDDLARACRPRRMQVRGDFNARGGIAISVTAEHPGPSRASGRRAAQR